MTVPAAGFGDVLATAAPLGVWSETPVLLEEAPEASAAALVESPAEVPAAVPPVGPTDEPPGLVTPDGPPVPVPVLAVPAVELVPAPLAAPFAAADAAAAAATAGEVGGGERLPGAGKCPPLDPSLCALFETGLRAADLVAA